MKLNEYIEATTQSAFASQIGVTQGMVHQWISGIRQVSAERCLDIEKATGGQVTCEELRPDIDWAYLRGTEKRAA